MPQLAIGAGTSIIGGILGARASDKAAKIQQENAQKVATMAQDATTKAQAGMTQAVGDANTGIQQSVTDATGKLQGVYDTSTAAINPYQQLGQTGVSALADYMKPGGAGTAQFSFNPSDLQNEPGYQFQLQQGMKALQNSRAAMGGLQSGGTVKSLMDFNQGLAGTSYQNAYNRAANTFQMNRTNTLGGLMGLANLGMSANQQAIGVGENYGNNTANMLMQGGLATSGNTMSGAQFNGNTGMQGMQIAGNALTGGANAQAAGTVGSANAWNQALGGVGNAAQFYSLSKMMQPQASSPTIAPGTTYGPSVPVGYQWPTSV